MFPRKHLLAYSYIFVSMFVDALKFVNVSLLFLVSRANYYHQKAMTEDYLLQFQLSFAVIIQSSHYCLFQIFLSSFVDFMIL